MTGPYATPARCRHCGASTLRTNRDHLSDVTADIEIEPVVLDRDAAIACVITSRTIYRYTVEGGKLLLGRAHPTNGARRFGDGVSLLPAHVCGRPLPGTPLQVAPQRPSYADVPVW